ncbi:MAG: glycerate 2-kinase [Sulfolobaceae archaeon]
MNLRETDYYIQKVLEFSDPYNALKEKIRIKNNFIIAENRKFRAQKPLLIAVGKASFKMAKFFIERIKVRRSILIKPKGSPKVTLENTEIIEAPHPIPDEDSIRAAQIVLETLRDEDYDLLLFLISGGASSMLELSNMTLEELRDLYKKLIESGISINEINIVRKHVSEIKGGKLALKSKSPILTLAVSDVPGDEISSIGSGPTVPDLSSIEDARKILIRLNLQNYLKYLKETPKYLNNSYYHIILNNFEVLKKLASLHKNSFILSSEISGDARSLGEFLASIYNSTEIYGIPFKKPYLLLAGGEPEVKLLGKAGKGGRNGETLLGFAKRKRVRGKFRFYAIATDGIDGNSEYAGGVIDENFNVSVETIEEYLSNHSSYELLERYNAVIKTGYTFTNVNNIYLLLVE